jgi:hypothetical protein
MNLLDLPRELRDEIYACVLISPGSLRTKRCPTRSTASSYRNRLDTRLLCTSRLVHREASEVLYKENRFYLGHIFYTTPLIYVLRYFPYINAYSHLLRALDIQYTYSHSGGISIESAKPSGAWKRIRSDANALVALFPNLRNLRVIWGLMFQTKRFPNCPCPRGSASLDHVVEALLNWLRKCLAEDGQAVPGCLRVEWQILGRKTVDQDAFDEALQQFKRGTAEGRGGRGG